VVFWLIFEIPVRASSISALRAYDFRFFAVVDGDIVSKIMKQAHMVPAIQGEFSILKHLEQNLSQDFRVLILPFLSLCHLSLP
jgi:hypothetical protein